MQGTGLRIQGARIRGLGFMGLGLRIYIIYIGSKVVWFAKLDVPSLGRIGATPYTKKLNPET